MSLDLKPQQLANKPWLPRGRLPHGSPRPRNTLRDDGSMTDTHQPGLRDLGQRQLRGRRQAAGGLLLLSMVFHFKTCRISQSREHEEGGRVGEKEQVGTVIQHFTGHKYVEKGKERKRPHEGSSNRRSSRRPEPARSQPFLAGSSCPSPALPSPWH